MSVRVTEIRAQNHQGDVSATDIEWLCAAADLLEVCALEAHFKGVLAPRTRRRALKHFDYQIQYDQTSVIPES